MAKHFRRIVRCSLRDLYRSSGVDGFNDLLAELLGFDIENASWEVVGYDADNGILIRVTGNRF